MVEPASDHTGKAKIPECSVKTMNSSEKHPSSAVNVSKKKTKNTSLNLTKRKYKIQRDSNIFIKNGNIYFRSWKIHSYQG